MQTLVKATRANEVLSDLPVGRYTVTAKAVGSDGSKTALKVSMDYTDENPTESTSLLFDGFETCGHSGTFVKTTVWLGR